MKISRYLLLALVLVPQITFAQYDRALQYKNASIVLKNNRLVVGTDKIERTWILTKNGLKTVMLQNPKRTNPERSDAPQHSHSYCFAMGLPFQMINDTAPQSNYLLLFR
jgi:hypothetical protein